MKYDTIKEQQRIQKYFRDLTFMQQRAIGYLEAQEDFRNTVWGICFGTAIGMLIVATIWAIMNWGN